MARMNQSCSGAALQVQVRNPSLSDNCPSLFLNSFGSHLPVYSTSCSILPILPATLAPCILGGSRVDFPTDFSASTNLAGSQFLPPYPVLPYFVLLVFGSWYSLCSCLVSRLISPPLSHSTHRLTHHRQRRQRRQRPRKDCQPIQHDRGTTQNCVWATH